MTMDRSVCNIATGTSINIKRTDDRHYTCSGDGSNVKSRYSFNLNQLLRLELMKQQLHSHNLTLSTGFYDK
ncbi:Protein of unknown function [Cotesia congregata]|uniref:Uncharacterized protein n=1 Tax=Cotesia congregata TaxID=51543 RepID=A0A8J2HFW5_COTCN|nr:Protein of unknown function [Cotesia congregata]